MENARFKVGEKLVATIKKGLGPCKLAQVDVVISIPETLYICSCRDEAVDEELASGFVKRSELWCIQCI